MYHGRSGGNARKRKAKLTDATFHAMIGTVPDAEAVAALLVDPVHEDAVVARETIAAVAVMIEDTVSAATASRVRGFRCQDYSFGYKVCGNCLNEQAYYVPRSALELGYTFRCRVCQLVMTVTN